MLHYPNFEIFGAALYKEDKNDGNNLCKIELFCAERENKGIGSRLMINLIHYMTCKKFYSEVFIEADLFAVQFFINFEFVLIEYKDLEERKKKVIGQH